MALTLNQNPVAARETAAQEIQRFAETLASRAHAAAVELEDRLANVSSPPPPQNETETRPSVILPPLWDQMRHSLRVIEEALERIEGATRRAEV